MRFRVFTVAAFTTLLVLGFTVESKAIPAFARKYKTSCTTCHTAPPARNAFGEAFRRNGYVMPVGDDELIKDKPVDLGAEAWKDVFPDAVWPGFLPPSFPLAAYAHQRTVFDFSDNGNHVEFDMPHEFELLIGGSFGESIGFFGEWVAFEKGVNAKGLKRFFIQFNDLLGPRNAFNLKMGRFEPGITDGYKDANRMTLEHAKLVDYKATGQWRPRDQQSGIEINGILGKRFNYAVGIVNGQARTLKDAKDRKDVFFRIGTKLGGMSLEGVDEAGLELKTSNNWVDNTLQLGFFGYRGSIDDEKWTDANEVDHVYSRNFSRLGFDLMLGIDRLKLLTGVIGGTDEDVSKYGGIGSKDVSSLAWFTEGQLMIYPWMIGVLRYGGANTEQNSIDLVDYTDFSANLTILARANVRLSLEAYFKSEDSVEKNLRWIKINTMYMF